MSFANIFSRRKSPTELCKSVKKHLDILQQLQSQHPLLFQDLINARNNSDNNNNNNNNNMTSPHHNTSSSTSNPPHAGMNGNSNSVTESPSSPSHDSVKAQLDKSLGKVNKYLHDMRVTILGDPDSDSGAGSVNDEDSGRLTDELLVSDLLARLIELAVSRTLEFESRKECSNIATYIFHHKPAQSIEFLTRHKTLRQFLQQHYSVESPSLSYPDIVLECGALLREAIHHKPVAELMIDQDHLIDKLFDLVQLQQFDISSDAWQTFRLILTENKEVSARYLMSNFEEFVSKFTKLLQSDNFVTKRQSLKLLSDLLVCRSNYEFMMKFTASIHGLRDIMQLCRTKSLCVQLEAFNVLKLFIANPKKADDVSQILSRNKAPLTAFLRRIAEGVTEEEEKNGNRHDEAFILIAELDKLPPPTDLHSPHGAMASPFPASSSSSSSATPVHS